MCSPEGRCVLPRLVLPERDDGVRAGPADIWVVESGLVKDTAGLDRRRRLLRLTSLGTRKRAEAYPLWEGAQRMVADEFGEADVAELLARLRRLRESSDRLFDA